MAQLMYGMKRAALRTFCLEQVARHMSAWPEQRALLIVPEQSKMDMERDLLDKAGGSLMLAEVLSFRRLAWRLLSEIGAQPRQSADSIGQAIILRRICKQEKSQLHYFASLADRPGFIKNIASVMGDLKRYQIDPEALKNAAKQCIDVSLSRKMSDFGVVLQAYQQILSESGLSDAEDDLNELSDVLRKLSAGNQRHGWPLSRLSWLRNCRVWVSGFAELRAFTPQELSILKSLNSICDQVVITAAADFSPQSKSDIEAGPDFFLPGRKTIWQIQAGLPVTRIQKLADHEDGDKDCENSLPALKLSEELLYDDQREEDGQPLRRQTGGQRKHEDQGSDETSCRQWLQLIQALDTDQEVNWAAGEIKRLVQCEGYRYRDLVIAASNMPMYAGSFKAACRLYGIPLFLDAERALSGSVLLRFVLSLLDISVSNWHRHPVMNCLRTGLLTDDMRAVDRLENHALAWGLFRGDRIFSKQYDRVDGADADWPAWREKLLFPLKKLLDTLKSAVGGPEKCVILQRFLIDINIPAILEQKISSLTEDNELEEATALAQSWQELDRIFRQMALLSDQKPMGLKSFRDYLAAAIDSVQTGAIPTAVDQISFGDLRHGLLRQPKVIILLGTAAGQFPPGWPPEGLLKDKEREQIAFQLDCDLPSHTRDQAFADQFMIYTLLTLPEEKLILTCAGKEPSPWFRRLAERFPACLNKLTPLPGLDDVRLNAPEPALSYWLMNAAAGNRRSDEGWHVLGQLLRNSCCSEAQSPDLLLAAGGQLLRPDASLSSSDLLAGSDGSITMSVSQLEQYAGCPFRHLGLSLLRLQERTVWEPQAHETGILLHGIAELAMRELKHDLMKIDGRDGGQFKALIAAWLQKDMEQEALRWMDKSASQLPFNPFNERGLRASVGRRAGQIASASLEAILTQLNDQSYQPEAVEFVFGPQHPCRYVIRPAGMPEIAFRGVIDRVDCQDDEQQKLFRIIDYKSGSKTIDYDLLYHGLDLQLPIYLDAFQTSHPEWQAASAGYFHFDRPLIRLEQAQDYQPAEVADKISKTFSLKCFQEEPAVMRQFRLHARSKAIQWTTSMLRGQYQASPARLPGKKPVCTWCHLRAVCGFDSRDGAYRWLKPVDQIEELSGSGKKSKFINCLSQYTEEDA